MSDNQLEQTAEESAERLREHTKCRMAQKEVIDLSDFLDARWF